jgi:hypothetical protein
MDEAGVDKAAIVQSVSTHGYDCSYVADSCASSPRDAQDLFVGPYRC